MFIEALEYFHMSLEKKENIKGKRSIETADIIFNIGIIYNEQGNYPQALDYYQSCLEIYEKYKGKESIESANTLHEMGVSY